MSSFLQQKRIALMEGHRAKNIPADADVVVIGNTMKRGNPEVEAVLNRKLLYLSLPEALRNFFLRGRHNLVVTGTHGKTTTQPCLLGSWRKRGAKPAYVIGGIPTNFGEGARLNAPQTATPHKVRRWCRRE
jgi:UDP-N-acetylmuramate: L-alanyl-gamma-D-glutamyl-meso-diaminopimelate ligase